MPSGLARLAPPVLKRAHERVSTERFRRASAKVNAAVADRLDGAVIGGPFDGLRYPREMAQAAKLVGAYECELHDAFADWIARPPGTIVDVGCGEGYYAVGFAVVCPGTAIVGFDADPAEQARCRRLAEFNGVGERVEVRGACAPGDLAAFGEDVALLMDCEGAEAELLDPVAAPSLLRWRIVVELHEFAAPGVTDVVRERFDASHRVEVLQPRARDAAAYPELAFLGRRGAAVALDEHRPPGMAWAILTPRRANAARTASPARCAPS
jgi:hypothetical protein